MMLRITACLIMLILAACGPLNEGGTGVQLGQAVLARVAGAEQPVQQSAGVPQDALLANPGKYLRVNARATGRWLTMVQAGQNGSRVTWIDSSNISLTLENGIVVATRGLPRDLMGSDVSQTWSAIRAGGGNSQRQHDFLTDIDGISTELLQCRIASQGPEVIERLQKTLNSVRFEEECRGEGLGFTNVYWVNRDGGMIRSLQAISPDAGYLQIDVY